jgi:hypothetical protein
VTPNHIDVVGYWKITSMDEWDRAYVDLVVPGFIEFENIDGEHITGGFQFGTVSGGLHAHARQLGDDLSIEWSWQGRNDNDPGCGRGWAKIAGGHLVGRFYVHLGDNSAFAGERQERPRGAGPDRMLRGARLRRI